MTDTDPTTVDPIAELTAGVQLLAAQLTHQAASVAALRAQVNDLAEAVASLQFTPTVETAAGVGDYVGLLAAASEDELAGLGATRSRAAASRAPNLAGLGLGAAGGWWVPIATSVIQPLIPVLQQALLAAILRATGATMNPPKPPQS